MFFKKKIIGIIQCNDISHQLAITPLLPHKRDLFFKDEATVSSFSWDIVPLERRFLGLLSLLQFCNSSGNLCNWILPISNHSFYGRQMVLKGKCWNVIQGATHHVFMQVQQPVDVVDTKGIPKKLQSSPQITSVDFWSTPDMFLSLFVWVKQDRHTTVYPVYPAPHF